MLPEFLKSINHDLVLLVGSLMIAGVGTLPLRPGTSVCQKSHNWFLPQMPACDKLPPARTSHTH